MRSYVFSPFFPAHTCCAGKNTSHPGACGCSPCRLSAAAWTAGLWPSMSLEGTPPSSCIPVGYGCLPIYQYTSISIQQPGADLSSLRIPSQQLVCSRYVSHTQ